MLGEKKGIRRGNSQGSEGSPQRKIPPFLAEIHVLQRPAATGP